MIKRVTNKAIFGTALRFLILTYFKYAAVKNAHAAPKLILVSHPFSWKGLSSYLLL